MQKEQVNSHSLPEGGNYNQASNLQVKVGDGVVYSGVVIEDREESALMGGKEGSVLRFNFPISK